MGLLIDTSVIIRIERDNDSLDEFVADLGGEESAISSITASELLVGVFRADTENRRAQRESFFEHVFERFPVLPFDSEVARTHARLTSELQTTRSMIGLHDLLIAATAIANGHAVLTYNVREFARVPGLDVRIPDSP